MSELIRGPKFIGGGITEDELRRLKEHADIWVKRILRTDPIVPDRIKAAITELYKAAKLAPPPPDRIVIVPSPLVMAFAGGFAAGIWYLRKTGCPAADRPTLKATDDTTSQAAKQATFQATRLATDRATDEATEEAARQATEEAARQATEEAARQATEEATLKATDATTRQATDEATRLATGQATSQATIQATFQATVEATFQATDEATAQATSRATFQATDDATNQAARQATEEAALKATEEATLKATDEATRLATSQATSQATWRATNQATRQATRLATLEATEEATRQATIDAASGAVDRAICNYRSIIELANDIAGPAAPLLLECACNWWRMYQGGNMWGQYDSYLTGARDILGLRLSAHDKYIAWERCAIEGGFRIIHEKFCIVSDFPELITTDERSRPHCDNGPSHRWRDGWELYHWHGVPVPKHAIMCPETITLEEINSEEDAEVRRALIERMTPEKYLWESKAELVDMDHEKCRFGSAPRALLRDSRGSQWLVGTDGSTKRVYYMSVPDNVTTCREAHEAICSFDESRILSKS